MNPWKTRAVGVHGPGGTVEFEPAKGVEFFRCEAGAQFHRIGLLAFGETRASSITTIQRGPVQ